MEGGIRAPGRGGFFGGMRMRRREGDREWGVKMVLTGRERWEDLNSKKI